MTITTIFDPPLPTDPVDTFNAKAFDTMSKLNAWGDEANDTAADVNADAAAAAVSAATASTAADDALASEVASAANAAAAAASAGAAPWASGSYNAGQAARSTVDYRIYVARTTGSKPTDPSADPTNWGLASANGLQLIDVTGTTQTAAAGGRYVLKNAAATTLTAPPSPQVGDEFAVKWTNGRYDNAIDFGGAKVEGGATTTLTLNDSPRGAAHWVWIDSTIGWGAIV